jgi:hypothetical protein
MIGIDMSFLGFFTEFCGSWMRKMGKGRDGNLRSDSLRTLRKNAWAYGWLEGGGSGFEPAGEGVEVAIGMGEGGGGLPGMREEFAKTRFVSGAEVEESQKDEGKSMIIKALRNVPQKSITNKNPMKKLLLKLCVLGSLGGQIQAVS